MWRVDTNVDLFDGECTYSVSEEVDCLPLDFVFANREDAEKLAKWLNKKDDWTDRLEEIVEHHIGEEKLEEIREKFEKMERNKI